MVQAKRNKPRYGLPWYDFGYRTGAGDRQIDLLLAHAIRLGVPAAYVLYNHPRIGPGVTLGRPCCVASYEGWRTRLGVAVVPALLAQPLVGASEDVAVQHARPLECLACAGLRPRVLLPVASSIVDPDLRNFLDGGSMAMPRVVALGLLAQLAQMRIGQFTPWCPPCWTTNRTGRSHRNSRSSLLALPISSQASTPSTQWRDGRTSQAPIFRASQNTGWNSTERVPLQLHSIADRDRQRL